MESHASISPDVLSRYVRDAALGVPGVRALVERALPHRRGIKITDNGGGLVTVELRIAVEWGASMPAVGRDVQRRVREYLERMARVSAARVDVVVDEVVGP